ncbi:fibrinogen-like protein 1 [Lucilia sericata]|uniref:fibrinogen-like protein 1 n=1 Tax=Lucilia sericata TaxID=13632 RepID=UPI0018A7FE6D|nr:fibrinogen-like protein 1 [Lucilia sericata]
MMGQNCIIVPNYDTEPVVGYCHQSHLNGPYLEKPVSEKGEKGIVWDLWHGMNYSLKFVLMMVRSKAE